MSPSSDRPTPGGAVARYRRRVRVFAVVLVAFGWTGCEPPPKLQNGVTPEQHTATYFPITAGNPHALGAQSVTGPIACESCHSGTDSFATPKCIVCHDRDPTPLDRVHAVVAAFVHSDSACLRCHADGLRGAEIGAAEHSRLWFSIDTNDVHGNAAFTARIAVGQDQCSACHASTSDRSLALCAECHAQDTAPNLVDGHAALAASFKNDSVSCKSCHENTPINPVVHPLTGHNVFFDPNHHCATCNSCHQTNSIEKPWSLEFAGESCTLCHPGGCTPASLGACTSLGACN